MISCDDKTAETGNTPPERALPKIKMSGLKSWWSQQIIFPVLAIPV